MIAYIILGRLEKKARQNDYKPYVDRSTHVHHNYYDNRKVIFNDQEHDLKELIDFKLKHESQQEGDPAHQSEEHQDYRNG